MPQLTQRLKLEHGAARVVDARRPKFGLDLQPVAREVGRPATRALGRARRDGWAWARCWCWPTEYPNSGGPVLCCRHVKLIVKWLLSARRCCSWLTSTAASRSGASARRCWRRLVIGLLNTVVRPVLVVLTLPVTVVTLGLFLFVINALMFWAAGERAGRLPRAAASSRR